MTARMLYLLEAHSNHNQNAVEFLDNPSELFPRKKFELDGAKRPFKLKLLPFSRWP